MRFGSGGPNDFVDPSFDYEDDAYWEVTRGRRDVRRCHDPLVTRILQLRGQAAGPRLDQTIELRRELDVLKYSATGARMRRLRKKLDTGGRVSANDRALLEAHEARLAVLYAELDQGRTRWR